MKTKIVDFLSLDERTFIIDYAMAQPWSHDIWGRFTCNIPVRDTQHLDWLYEKSASAASREFNTKTLLPTYYKFCRYSLRYGSPRVPPHVDENACTYTVDIQLGSSTQWSIYVDDEEYSMSDGDAIIYMGEEHLHWRPPFPTSDESDFVTMLFMHYAEPDHWFFQYGQDFMRNPEFHDIWIQKMRKLLASKKHWSMGEIDQNII